MTIYCIFAGWQDTFAQSEQTYEVHQEPDFGITMDGPSGWTMEGDNVWLHTTITPWHLPLVPIKELQPTAVDILLEGVKTPLVDFSLDNEDSMVLIRSSVEKMPLGMNLDGYVEHTLDRLRANNENVVVVENTKTTISGNPAIRLLITHGEEEYAAETLQILTTYGNLAYVFQYDGSGQIFDANLGTAQHVFESVTISPPASRAQSVILILVIIGAGVGGVMAVAIKRKKAMASQFIEETKKLFPSAFGIEVLCVASAEIGGFLALWHFGFNTIGIIMSYGFAYGFAGFTTFSSILGRSAKAHDEHEIICGCSELAGHGHGIGFAAGIRQSFSNFWIGLKMIASITRNPIPARVLRASLYVLISAESGCVIAAATVDIILYQYSAFLSIPVALVAGTFTVATMAAYRSVKREKDIARKIG